MKKRKAQAEIRTAEVAGQMKYVRGLNGSTAVKGGAIHSPWVAACLPARREKTTLRVCPVHDG